MRIFLHIGVWKTGSTAIQTFLAKNADELLRKGVMIPDYARDMKRYNHLFERLVVRDEPGVQDVADQLAKDIAAHRPETLILSSEHFWHAPPDVIRRTAALLRPLSDDIAVIAYIRPQDDMWASLYAQQAKFFRVRSGHDIWGNGDYVGPAIGENAMFYHRTFAVYADVFGAHADCLMISSTKSMHGHLIGGTGAVELLACIMALKDGIIAPTIGYEEADPECALDVVPNEAREAKINVALSNAFAFGGLNAVLALKRV